VVDTSAKAVDASVRRFERAWDRMHKLANDNAYPTKVGPLCGWCELVNGCPAAQAAGKVDLSNTDKDENGIRYVVTGKKLKGYSVADLGIPTLRAGAEPLVADLIVVSESEPAKAVSAPARSAASTSTADALNEITARRTVPATAAHRTDDPTQKAESSMTNASVARVKEATNRNDATVDGVLAGGSKSSSAVFQLSNLAVKHLSENEQRVDGVTVNALTQTYAHIVREVERAFSGSTSWESGLNIRVRGALATTVETLPAPWGGTVDEWDAWVISATKRTKAIAGVAIKLFEAGATLPDRPWDSLAAA
jgi:putative RecB family exonuclease